jgi:hypothetical protein
VEVISGQVVRTERPDRAHQAAARQITGMLDAAAGASMAANPGTCLDAGGRFSVLVREDPAPTIRSPDAALFACAPGDVGPLPAHLIKVIVEVVSPGTRKTDTVAKMAEYADAGIPYYWLAWLDGDQMRSIDVHVLDQALGHYRLDRTLTPEQEVSVIDVPVRIEVDWGRLARLVRQ